MTTVEVMDAKMKAEMASLAKDQRKQADAHKATMMEMEASLRAELGLLAEEHRSAHDDHRAEMGMLARKTSSVGHGYDKMGEENMTTVEVMDAKMKAEMASLAKDQRKQADAHNATMA